MEVQRDFFIVSPFICDRQFVWFITGYFLIILLHKAIMKFGKGNDNANGVGSVKTRRNTL